MKFSQGYHGEPQHPLQGELDPIGERRDWPVPRLDAPLDEERVHEAEQSADPIITGPIASPRQESSRQMDLPRRVPLRPVRHHDAGYKVKLFFCHIPRSIRSSSFSVSYRACPMNC